MAGGRAARLIDFGFGISRRDGISLKVALLFIQNGLDGDDDAVPRFYCAHRDLMAYLILSLFGT